MRLHHGPGFRIYFITQGTELIVLLCAGDKDSQRRDIERARRMAKEWRNSCLRSIESLMQRTT